MAVEVSKSNDKYKNDPAIDNEKIKNATININIEQRNPKPFFEISIKIIIDTKSTGRQYRRELSSNIGNNKEITINESKNI